jgi:transposase-like protein
MMPGSYDLDELTLAQLADLREWQLERLEKVTTALRSRVQTAYAEGATVKALAKQAGVTRRTVYAWLQQ